MKRLDHYWSSMLELLFGIPGKPGSARLREVRSLMRPAPPASRNYSREGGLLQRIKAAPDAPTARRLLREGNDYTRASAGTRAKWQRAVAAKAVAWA